MDPVLTHGQSLQQLRFFTTSISSLLENEIGKKSLYLEEKDCAELAALLSEGEVEVKVFKRGKALLELDHGETLPAVARTLCRWSKVLSQNI